MQQQHLSTDREGIAARRNFKLTLENFEFSENVPEDCPFVLTSPRSLQACKLLGIKVRIDKKYMQFFKFRKCFHAKIIMHIQLFQSLQLLKSIDRIIYLTAVF